ncbi:MAG: hypothetical protein EXR07_04825 [Acetobacteraceae bacterium]|nr:hypothetical protein [Acetobacteraceae bacterium]
MAIGRGPRGKTNIGRRGFATMLLLGIGWLGRQASSQSGSSGSVPTPIDSPAEPILRLRSALLKLAAADWPPPSPILGPLVAAAFDLSGIAAAILGPAAATATPEQTARFAQAFGRRMVRELARNRPEQATDQFGVQEIRPIGTVEWLVITRSELPTGPAVLSWRVRGLQEGPRIVDLSRDGISAIEVQRRDLASALRTRPLEDVLADIESRLAR